MPVTAEKTPAETLTQLLQNHRSEIGKVIDADLNANNVTKLDFSANNPLLLPEIVFDTPKFTEVVNLMLENQDATIGIGGYLENRVIYRRSQLFEEAESRSLHLGIDIWAPAGISVYAPLSGIVHSFQDNANFGDYGPTIILQHELEGFIFHTLYGHLNRASLKNLQVGNAIEKGQKIAEFGPFPENGDWPPHLHFQVITDLQGIMGDFPGVCKPSEQALFTAICPDPNLILQSRHLL